VKPRTSVVIAAYNAGHLLRYAIASVRLQDRDDWEIVVVSDHSTDDTAAVVASFADERIRFIDLPVNSGQQATPNNVGVRAARGEYLAFLNQDDLYLPNHLSENLACLRRTGADLVCSPYAAILPEQAERIAARELAARVEGFEPRGHYSPRTFHLASSWFMRRASALAFGPWRLEHQMWVTPSQDWLFRAWRRGARIHCSDRITVVALYSGCRPSTYRGRETREHEFVFEETIASERLRPELLEPLQHWITEEAGRMRRGLRRRKRNLKKRVPDLLRAGRDALITGVGVHPNTFLMMRRYGRARGGLVDAVQRFHGLVER
jgi:glycosyltransferase involved in cell wall biosynthesis